MNKLEDKIYEIIKKHRKKRRYLVKGTTFDNPDYFTLKSIWFSEIFKIIYPDLILKNDLEKKRVVKNALKNLENEKKIGYGVGEPIFYILYEDRDKLI